MRKHVKRKSVCILPLLPHLQPVVYKFKMLIALKLLCLMLRGRHKWCTPASLKYQNLKNATVLHAVMHIQQRPRMIPS